MKWLDTGFGTACDMRHLDTKLIEGNFETSQQSTCASPWCMRCSDCSTHWPAMHDLCLNMMNVASMSRSYIESLQEVGAHVLRSD